MKIIHLSAECYPIAKVGGLADVVGALPKYQNNSDISSQVIMPFYDIKFTKAHTFEAVFSSFLESGMHRTPNEIDDENSTQQITTARLAYSYWTFLVRQSRRAEKAASKSRIKSENR
ncbi:glycogen/starch synthase [uncultured Kiloniella sp.]|uniref:glycogen/starch synthase n=1 Tax=uncultured Kiloniella sp. TaxID=1133091 RepID=UPI00261472C9|nr:glycogen/starch synthase [uncultured Kiloniella sp.]